ncbi:PH domain-containing protein, partial [Candidatus Woesearchaeota archaeon]|nr:PH domain-containing protein [Candidatus Woesearchaeota archaeon]
MEQYELTPNKNAYVKWPLIQYFILTGIVFGIPILITLIGGTFLPFLLFISIGLFLLWALITSFVVISLNARFKKERYLFFGEKIECKSGGIISDAETELMMKNVTHVKIVRPWLENKFFGTGSIHIQSAGSGGTEAHIKHIDNPEKFYGWIQKLLKQNGFSLTQKELLREEKPNPLGVFFETIGSVVGFGFFALYVLLEPALDMISKGGTMNIGVLLLMLAILLIVGVPVTLIAIFRYLDLKNRTYKVFSDMVTYNEGFLNKHDAFIPVENVSDAETTQNIIDRIFSLYDVKVSCQGAGQEILFKNLKNGKEMAASIDKLVSNKKVLVAKKEEAENKTVSTTKNVAEKTNSAVKAKFDTTFTGEFKPSIKRAMIGLLSFAPLAIIIFPLLPIYIIGLIVRAITLSVTTYHVKKESIEYDYKLLRAVTTEFTNDRITRATVKRNPFDYWMKTATVEFWSIGSGSNIKYQYIPQEIVPQLLAKIGVQPTDVSYEVKPKYSVFTSMARNPLAPLFFFALFFGGIFATIWSVWFAAVPILLVLFTLANIIWSVIVYKRAYLRCTGEGVESFIGIIFKTWDYALYDNIKGIRTKKYLASKKGMISFNVAGESIQTTQKGQQVTTNNEIHMPYIPEIQNKDELFDTIFT